jgi:hypothetical protein
VVEIQYKAFIAPSAVYVGNWNLINWDYFNGNDRWFDSDWGASSKMKLKLRVTVDPTEDDGLIDDSLAAEFGTSRGYEDEDLNDVEACEHCAGSFGDYCLKDTATPECEATDQVGVDGNQLQAVVVRESTDLIKVTITAHGANACANVAAAIDFYGVIYIQQVCDGESLGPVEYWYLGNHDGFPWHELYLDGTMVYNHDPCQTGDTPFSLIPGYSPYAFNSEQWIELP